MNHLYFLYFILDLGDYYIFNFPKYFDFIKNFLKEIFKIIILSHRFHKYSTYFTINLDFVNHLNLFLFLQMIY